MGISDLHLLLASLDFKGMVLNSNSSGGPLRYKVLKAQAMRRRRNRSRRMVVKRNNGGVQRLRTRSLRISMKRRGSAVLSEGFTRSAAMRPMNEVEKKVRTLKKLIPNYGSNSMGLDGLFRETAEYIECLQMQVKLMQVMVKALSAGSDDC